YLDQPLPSVRGLEGCSAASLVIRLAEVPDCMRKPSASQHKSQRNLHRHQSASNRLTGDRPRQLDSRPSQISDRSALAFIEASVISIASTLRFCDRRSRTFDHSGARTRISRFIGIETLPPLRISASSFVPTKAGEYEHIRWPELSVTIVVQ